MRRVGGYQGNPVSPYDGGQEGRGQKELGRRRQRSEEDSLRTRRKEPQAKDSRRPQEAGKGRSRPSRSNALTSAQGSQGDPDPRGVKLRASTGASTGLGVPPNTTPPTRSSEMRRPPPTHTSQGPRRQPFFPTWSRASLPVPQWPGSLLPLPARSAWHAHHPPEQPGPACRRPLPLSPAHWEAEVGKAGFGSQPAPRSC